MALGLQPLPEAWDGGTGALTPSLAELQLMLLVHRTNARHYHGTHTKVSAAKHISAQVFRLSWGHARAGLHPKRALSPAEAELGVTIGAGRFYGGERWKLVSAAHLQTAAGTEPSLPSQGLGSISIDVIEHSNASAAPAELAILFCLLEAAKLLLAGFDGCSGWTRCGVAPICRARVPFHMTY